MSPQQVPAVLLEPTRFGLWVAGPMLSRMKGPGLTRRFLRWALRRWPSLFMRRVIADKALGVVADEQIARMLASKPRKP
jgi:hypothetical protein